MQTDHLSQRNHEQLLKEPAVRPAARVPERAGVE